jgi:hypothetical protein
METLVIAALVGGTVALGLLAVYVRSGYSWDTWIPMQLAKPRIRKLARQRGVAPVKIVWFGGGRINSKETVIWLKTDLNQERDTLEKDPTFRPAIENVLKHCGYPQAAIPSIELGVQSQQWVDQNCGGDWTNFFFH